MNQLLADTGGIMGLILGLNIFDIIKCFSTPFPKRAPKFKRFQDSYTLNGLYYITGLLGGRQTIPLYRKKTDEIGSPV